MLKSVKMSTADNGELDLELPETPEEDDVVDEAPLDFLRRPLESRIPSSWVEVPRQKLLMDGSFSMSSSMARAESLARTSLQ